jgi:exodeoxyribonuclease V gamma subunit
MLRVVHANRLDQLASALAERLPALGDPFARPTVVVASNLVARWVTYALATQRGIAAHLELPFFDAWVARTWADRGSGLVALDRAKLAALAGSALADDELLAEPVMAPARDYLDADRDPDPRIALAARAVRRAQLAERVAELYWEYALTRPEWIEAWIDDAPAPADVPAETWAWQGRLWTAIEAATRAAGACWVPTPRLPRARRALGLAPPRTITPVHVIGFSFLAPAYLEALADLDGEVTVYAPSPCAELWEDVGNRSKRRRPSKGATVAADTDEDPAPLRLWGGPARDTIGRLTELARGDLDDRFVDPGRATALAALRSDMLLRAAPSASEDRTAAGVQILACPSLRRELEIVASDLRRRLDADPALRANQIAVLIAGDADGYLDQLDDVFAAVAVPFHVVDAPLVEHGRVAEAAQLLLELPLGRFTRPELLGLMTHPAVLARHRHVDPEDWVAWTSRLGIVHGATGADHAGTYLAALDRFHWDQGIRRLALGAFMAPLDDAGARFGGHTYLPEPIPPDQRASAATFALLARSLIADATWLRDQQRTLTGWAEVLAAMVATYLGASDEAATRELGRLAAELDGLRDLDLDGRALGYAEVASLARRRLARLRGDRGATLAHGALIAPLAPGRALPVRIAYVLGLGEGAFPRTATASPLDLRTLRKRGDVDTGDRDRLAFLETVMAADELVLSYVAADLATGEALGPSTVVVELAAMLAPYLPASPAPLDRLTQRHPLHRWDPAYDHDLPSTLLPSAARERHAARVRSTLIEAMRRAGRTLPGPRDALELLRDPRFAALRLPLRLDLLDHTGATAGPPAPRTLSLTLVRKFLESPAQAWAEAVIGLEATDDDDERDVADEPFVTEPKARAIVLREVIALHVGAGDRPAMAIRDAYERVATRRGLASAAPVGVFGEVEVERDLAQLERWAEAIAAAGGGAPWRRIGIGRATTAATAVVPGIALDIPLAHGLARIELVGQTELLGHGLGALILAVGKSGGRHRLAAALEQVVCAAADIPIAPRHLLVDVGGARAEAHLPWTRADARAYLTALVTDMFAQPHAYALSLTEIDRVLDGKPLGALQRPTEQSRGSLGYGPLGSLDDLTRLTDGEARALIERRHRPLLAHLPGAGKFGGAA